jgi:citrate lyase subunit beta/citryl-CoA lyase
VRHVGSASPEEQAGRSAQVLLYRSLLFVPGDDSRKMAKATAGTAADVLIVDLEDAVAESRKDLARDRLTDTLTELRGAVRLVRVNALGTGRAEADIEAAIAAGADGVVAPKVDDGNALRRFETAVDAAGDPTAIVVPLVESAAALVHLESVVSASSRAPFLALGAGDLVTDLGLPPAAHDDPGGIVDTARSMLVLHSRAGGLQPPVDSPELQVRDQERFRARCEHAKVRGFAGILCIHPAQVAVANDVFSPSAPEVEQARSVVEAFTRLERAGTASITVDDAFVDYPIAAAARRVLARHELIQRHGDPCADRGGSS